MVLHQQSFKTACAVPLLQLLNLTSGVIDAIVQMYGLIVAGSEVALAVLTFACTLSIFFLLGGQLAFLEHVLPLQGIDLAFCPVIFLITLCMVSNQIRVLR